ncbi:hypothetical protein [Methylotuvimicrobium sp. KM1]|uniref:hypothetical protein n=1 Tax=Methylotuvimicrobium sp. KM1 TaxID=3377707 RepID=UPI00384A8BAC
MKMNYFDDTDTLYISAVSQAPAWETRTRSSSFAKHKAVPIMGFRFASTDPTELNITHIPAGKPDKSN